MRLDNCVYRLGFADSRPQARQLVRHGHFEVNGVPTDIPSYHVKPGVEIRVRDRARGNEYFKIAQPQLSRKQIAPWMELNAGTMVGRVLRVPSRDELDIALNESLIVEYYSR
jgi:small subunit ribosomal protein S4